MAFSTRFSKTGTAITGADIGAASLSLQKRRAWPAVELFVIGVVLVCGAASYMRDVWRGSFATTPSFASEVSGHEFDWFSVSALIIPIFFV